MAFRNRPGSLVMESSVSRDGAAAYGKILKKKAILVSRDWFPYVLKILGHPDTLETRYRDGLISKSALDVYQCIQNNEGIDTREFISNFIYLKKEWG